MSQLPTVAFNTPTLIPRDYRVYGVYGAVYHPGIY